MNKLITLTKIGLIGSLAAAALTGCSLFGNDRCCDKPCRDAACCQKACPERKTSGVNTSMTLGVGTDGISVGSESNVGSHGLSGSVSTH